ncbi:hypothetical protein NKH60_18585 [Mesorhizobium sp. M1006]|uniref:hypothetical protein n=1 Tax=Mesorhizobium sp. M1006 TaxID=2957048 RepID=UPI00333C4C2C
MAKSFWIGVLCAMALTPCSAIAETICRVPELGPQLATFGHPHCEGSLTPDEAIECVNYLAEQADDQRRRAEFATAQAECLCKALNEIAGGFGHYSRLNGSCSVEQ